MSKLKFLVQRGSGSLYRESSMLIAQNKYSWEEIHYDDLRYKDFGDFTFIPLGSVEFTEEYARCIGIQMPQSLSYPHSLRAFFKRRNLRIGPLSSANSLDFVKPIKTKEFCGTEKHQLNIIVDPNKEVWISDPIEFTSEFRFYIHNGAIAGYSQYDDGDDVDVGDELESFVRTVIDAFHDQPIAYTIDVGYTSVGIIEAVEINDAWALGYYNWGRMSFASYLDMIRDRWLEIVGVV